MSCPSRPNSQASHFLSFEKKMELRTPERAALPASPLPNRSGTLHHSLPLRLYDESLIPISLGGGPTLQYASATSSSTYERPSLNIQGMPSPSSPGPRSPAPSMSNSSKKIQQIMGFDISPQFFGHVDDAGVSLASSGSVYSTNEDGKRLSAQLFAERARDENAARSFVDPSDCLQEPPPAKSQARSSNWSFAEVEHFSTRRLDERGDRADEMATLNEMLFDEPRDVQSPVDSNYRRSLFDTRDLPLSPNLASPVSPLSPNNPRRIPWSPSPKAFKGRSKLKPLQVPKKPSFFANTHTREGYAWGMDDIPSRKKHYNTPITGIFSPGRDLSFPKTLPKSPLGQQHYGPSQSPSTTTNPIPIPSKFHKRLSNTVKSWSSSSSFSTPPNTKRKAPPINTSGVYSPHSGNKRVDTPMPSRPTFMEFSPTDTLSKGNGNFLDAVAKTRAKVGIKTKEERRRESLKNKIVVVGAADGSPDGLVSEWL